MEAGGTRHWRRSLAAFTLITAGLMVGFLSTHPPVAKGDSGPGGGDLAALSSVAVPAPYGGDIVNRAAAIRLGKALFWDSQVGGDGMTACASCHFHAGVDNRTINVINSGPNQNFEAVSGPGQHFNGAKIVSDDKVGSQGVVGTIFSSVNPDPSNPADICSADETPPFYHNRRVTGRNAPPIIAAVYNRQNFWDGRANNMFNGLDPFGQTGNAGGSIGQVIGNSSLASQAVGPPNNPTEMSCATRPFNGMNSLAYKMLSRPALQYQYVHPYDSALGAWSNWPSAGLKCGNHLCMYGELIEAAFGSSMAADALNKFSRIWGQAIQAYESTLIPDRTPFDLYMSGNRNALTSQQEKGLNIFAGKGNCAKCHSGAELTDASVSFAIRRGLINEDGGDQGFHNTGVRPTAEDIGRAGSGPHGHPFSESGSPMDVGAFKTPSLRNVKLTAPYMHNGGLATLGQVVDFYARGGDFPNAQLAKRIKPLSLSSSDKAALVDFVENGLTDCRVEKQEAPFDHPSLVLPNGSDAPATGGTYYCR